MYLRTNIYIHHCSPLLCYGCGKILTKSNLTASRCHEGKSEQEFKAGIWIQELNQRPRIVQLASLDLFNLLSYTTQDHRSRDGTIYRGLGPAATNINL